MSEPWTPPPTSQPSTPTLTQQRSTHRRQASRGAVPADAFSSPRPQSPRDASYPPRTDLSTSRPASPATPQRFKPVFPSITVTPPPPASNTAHSRPATPATLRRAINTTIPNTPVPPARADQSDQAFEDVELTQISPCRHGPTGTPSTPQGRLASHLPVQPHDSPFHDRHSIVVEPLGFEVDSPDRIHQLDDPFEYSPDTTPTKAKTMKGYQLAYDRPRPAAYQEKQSLGGFLESDRPVSEARRSIYPSGPPIPQSTLDQHPDLLPPSGPVTPIPLLPRSSPNAAPTVIKPRFRGLFALSTAQDLAINLLPAVILSVAASIVQPYMSIIIGDVFVVFQAYPLTTGTATEAQRAALRDGVSKTSLKLALTGVYAIALNYAKGVAWARHGEKIVSRLREAVFTGVGAKRMEWFDTGMGMRHDEEGEDREAIGVGGLMAKFTRETDDVRMGTTQMFGSAVQYFSTFILCFALALSRSPVLAIVTLSTIPLVVLVQIITQVICGPLYSAERRAFAEASTNVERATAAISTVKAHNAQKLESDRFVRLVNEATASLRKQAVAWAISIGLSDFLLLATFVTGFWYGAKVVRDGSATPGDVMTTFWACLLAASYLQLVVPQLTGMTKAKMSMASLRTIIAEPSRDDNANPFASPAATPTTPTFGKAALAVPSAMRKIRPMRCHGEFNFQNVSFAYPSRPDNLVLRDITLFLPPQETTFVVGGSGSGKSTIAQLLLRLYDPAGGRITLDDQDLTYLDDGYTREHIAAVSQGCILFDLSIHDNIAIGVSGAGPNFATGQTRRPEDVSRQEVEQACKIAGIHDFVVGLPQGYDTQLGTGGSTLSGGQKQRMAIARAVIRDPTVLILDEATSALDATSRVTVFANLKQWRQNRTTIVITHDLSQITSDDFVYVMKNGIVAEQGFRSDLMKRTPTYGSAEVGVFASMAAEQAVQPLPPKAEDVEPDVSAEDMDMEMLYEPDTPYSDRSRAVDAGLRGPTPSFSLRPQSMVYLDLLDEYSKGARLSALAGSSMPLNKAQRRLSWLPRELEAEAEHGVPRMGSRPGSLLSPSPIHAGRRSVSRQSSLGLPYRSSPLSSTRSSDRDGPTIRSRTLSQNLDDELKPTADLEVITTLPSVEAHSDRHETLPGIFALVRQHFPTLPRKPLLVIGVFGAVAHGVCTPVWASYLAKLMQAVGTGGTDPRLTTNGIILLFISLAQGFAYFLQDWGLYAVAAFWTAQCRTRAYSSVLAQDKAWFDASANSPARLVQQLIKDADDMRGLMGDVIGKFSVFSSMVGLGVVWAMVVQWRMTLVGLACAPVFAAVIVMNEVLIGRAEVAGKKRREAVAKSFYESVANIRGIRAMALESAFKSTFDKDAAAALRAGRLAGWYISIGVAASAALPLLAMALMNWAGAQFMLQNFFNYEQMLTVFNLVLFSLTFGTQCLDFIPVMSKVKAAARDFNRVYLLSDETSESNGDLRYPITGQISCSDLSFAYPARPDVPILTHFNLTLTPGETVAIVGPSGSGKSTVAALLQRLYEPSAGRIIMSEKYDLARADVKWLRNHIAVVSQSANLFDATVAENIAYGSAVPLGEIYRAAQAANIHDFIVSLPQGYDTNLGENASLISGGQAQRLQIARALVRGSKVLVLDECTSALDVDNARAVVDTIVRIKENRTTVFITHSIEAMKRCDRVVCLGDGRVIEDGPFDELIARGGAFAALMRTGEWE